MSKEDRDKRREKRKRVQGRKERLHRLNREWHEKRGKAPLTFKELKPWWGILSPQPLEKSPILRSRRPKGRVTFEELKAGK